MSTNGNSDAAAIYRRHFQSAARYRQELQEAEQTAERLRAEAGGWRRSPTTGKTGAPLSGPQQRRPVRSRGICTGLGCRRSRSVILYGWPSCRPYGRRSRFSGSCRSDARGDQRRRFATSPRPAPAAQSGAAALLC